MDEYFEPLSIIVQKLSDARKMQSKVLNVLSQKSKKIIIDILYEFDSERILNNRDLIYNSENAGNQSEFYRKLLDILTERNALYFMMFERVIGLNSLPEPK